MNFQFGTGQEAAWRRLAGALASAARRKWVQTALFGAAFLLFLIANRAAYRGWFSGDDLDNLFWTQYVSWREFAWRLFSPVFYRHNFRPVGHFFFYAMGRVAGLSFPWYVAAVHLLHGLNVWLVYRLARRLGSQRRAAAAAVVFFAFPMAAFDALWKPMYIFDLLCACFCLLCLLAYASRRYLAAWGCLWLAYKSKEMAVMLPLVLAILEWKFGGRRWLRLAPFFGVSLLFGSQALFSRSSPGQAYTLTFTWEALKTTVSFYASRAFLLPWAGLATLALPLIFRGRRVWLGTAAFWLLLAPVLFLPLRTYAAYLYVPLAFFALAVAGLAERRRWQTLVLAGLVWLAANHWAMRRQRGWALLEAAHHRAYFTQLQRAFQEQGVPECAAFDPPPPGLAEWGVQAAVRLASGNPRLEAAVLDSDAGRQCLARSSPAVLAWDPREGRLSVMRRMPGDSPPPYITMDNTAPVWRLGDGWFPRDVYFRWIGPRATATLARPPGARAFEVRVNVGPQLLERVRAPTLEVWLDGRLVGSHRFGRPGLHTARWTIPPAPGGEVAVEFRASPVLELEGRRYGIAICGFGFPPDAASRGQ
jgi:hypothetical protein